MWISNSFLTVPSRYAVLSKIVRFLKKIISLEKRKASQQSSLPNNLAGIVGATVGASVFVVIGVILASLALQ